MRRPSECVRRVASSAARTGVISLASVTSGRCACDWYVDPGSSFTHPRNIYLVIYVKWLLHMHIHPCSLTFTSSPVAVYDDCVYCLCPQLDSQAWRSSWLSCPFPLFSILLSVFLFFYPPDSSSPSQAKVRELEEKCRAQSEQFNLLSKELEKFRLHAGKFDILSTEPLTVCESPGSPNKSLSQLLNGLAGPIGKGGIIPPTFCLISHQYFKPVFGSLTILIIIRKLKSFQNFSLF